MGKYPDVIWRIWDYNVEEIFYHKDGRIYEIKYVTTDHIKRWTDVCKCGYRWYIEHKQQRYNNIISGRTLASGLHNSTFYCYEMSLEEFISDFFEDLL